MWPCSYGGGGCAVAIPGAETRALRTAYGDFAIVYRVNDTDFASWDCDGRVTYVAQVTGDGLTLVDPAPYTESYYRPAIMSSLMVTDN